MFKSKTIAGLAIAGAFVASGASAHESYGHSHYSTTTAPTTYGTTYAAPTINLGPIEQVQPSSTVQYTQPVTTYIQPATTTTYTAPVSSYTPAYTTPSYAAQTTYTAPSYGSTYTTPSYGTGYTTSNWATPSYGTTYTTPSYVAPAYVAPRYDATTTVQQRMDRLRSRIRAAADRGDLRGGERQKLRRKMRNIREDFRAYKANDGVIDQNEYVTLNDKMSRQSRRIRRLANNHRVAGPLVSPYGHYRY